jgi:Peptidase family M3
MTASCVSSAPRSTMSACLTSNALQFMENFCYERKTLFSFAKHHETGEPLPEELYQKLCAARTFRAGSMMMRQVQLGHNFCCESP